jgi:hypothetical protein
VNSKTSGLSTLSITLTSINLQHYNNQNNENQYNDVAHHYNILQTAAIWPSMMIVIILDVVVLIVLAPLRVSALPNHFLGNAIKLFPFVSVAISK